MNNFKISEKYVSFSADQVFKAGRASLTDLEMEIIKDRSIAYLLQARTIGGGDVINANIIVNAFQNEYSITLASETADQALLKVFADRFVEALKNHLDEQ